MSKDVTLSSVVTVGRLLGHKDWSLPIGLLKSSYKALIWQNQKSVFEIAYVELDTTVGYTYNFHLL